MVLARKVSKQSYLPEFVYGSMDGLVTTFAIVTGSVGAALPAGVILIVGFANVLADAFSMGASSYLSAVSEQSLNGTKSKKPPIKESIVTFFSFAIVGLIPLLPFLVAYAVPAFAPHAITTSVTATMIAFASVGYLSGKALGKNPLFTAVRNFLIGGAAASLAFGVGHVLGKIFGI